MLRALFLASALCVSVAILGCGGNSGGGSPAAPGRIAAPSPNVLVRVSPQPRPTDVPAAAAPIVETSALGKITPGRPNAPDDGAANTYGCRLRERPAHDPHVVRDDLRRADLRSLLQRPVRSALRRQAGGARARGGSKPLPNPHRYDGRHARRVHARRHLGAVAVPGLPPFALFASLAALGITLIALRGGNVRRQTLGR